jgi:SpoVK/Ycf46/Vps4 family AAA+-type ATPase
MATAEQIKSLLRSHFDNDSERFLTISLQVAAHEARQGHVALATEIKSLVDKLITKYMGETASKLRQIFEVIARQKGVYLFDEFDAIGAERGRENEVGEMRRVLNAFLQFIEHDKSESFIIAATNNPGILDKALFRRFNDILYYSLPEKDQIIQLIKNRLGTFKGTYKIEPLTEEIKALSHSDICQACDDAIKDAILEGKLKIQRKQPVYNLDAILSVDYRINSKRGTQFRQWAN